MAGADLAIALGIDESSLLARVGSVNRNGALFVPVRDAAMAFGYGVRWDAKMSCAAVD